MNMERINIHKADLPVTERSADYSLLASDAGTEVQFNTAVEALTATLPSAPEADNGYMAVIRNTGANNLTVAAPAGGTVDGSASITVNPQQSVWLRCDGLAWKTIAFGGCVSGYVPDADPGRAKAYGTTDGEATLAVLNSFNMSSLQDLGTGAWRWDYTNVFAESVPPTLSQAQNGNSGYRDYITIPTYSGYDHVSVIYLNSASVYGDRSHASTAFGDLA